MWASLLSCTLAARVWWQLFSTVMGALLSFPSLRTTLSLSRAFAFPSRRGRSLPCSSETPPLLELPDDVLLRILSHLSGGFTASLLFSRCARASSLPLGAAIGPRHSADDGLAFAETCSRLYQLHRLLHVKVLDLLRLEEAGQTDARIERRAEAIGLHRALERFPGVRSVFLRGADLARQSLPGAASVPSVWGVHFVQTALNECDVQRVADFFRAFPTLRVLEADTGFAEREWAVVLDALPKELQVFSMRQQFWPTTRNQGGANEELELSKLTQFRCLREFEFVGPRFLFHPDDFGALGSLLSLRILRVCAGVRLDDETFSKVKEVQNLRYLESFSLRGVLFSAECAANLPRLVGLLPESIRVLDLECSRACKHIYAPPLPPSAFAHLVNLENLAVGGSALRFESWNSLVGISTCLTDLEIAVRKVSLMKDIADIVPSLLGLRRLKFSMRLSSRAGPALTELLSLPHLSNLFLSLTSQRSAPMWSAELSEAFANASCGDSLRTLVLHNFGPISDKTVRAIFYSLPNLTAFHACDSVISETGLELLRVGMLR